MELRWRPSISIVNWRIRYVDVSFNTPRISISWLASTSGSGSVSAGFQRPLHVSVLSFGSCFLSFGVLFLSLDPRSLTFSGDFLCLKLELASEDACQMPLQLLTGQTGRRRFERRVAVRSSDVLVSGLSGPGIVKDGP
jgi:hypothetical protein